MRMAILIVLFAIGFTFIGLKYRNDQSNANARQEKNMENAKRAYEIAETGTRNGVMTELELLDAQLSMTEAGSNYNRSLFDWLIALADIEKATGNARGGSFGTDK